MALAATAIVHSLLKLFQTNSVSYSCATKGAWIWLIVVTWTDA
jgi:hypothetical protein